MRFPRNQSQVARAVEKCEFADDGDVAAQAPSVFPPIAEAAAVPAFLGARCLLLTLGRARRELRRLGALRGRGRGPALRGDGAGDVEVAVRLVGEVHARALPASGVVAPDGGDLVGPVDVLVDVVHAVMLLHPIGDVGLAVIGDGRGRVPEAEDLVRSGGRVQLALLRDLPLLAHHALEVFQEVSRRRLQMERGLDASFYTMRVFAFTLVLLLWDLGFGSNIERVAFLR